MDNKVENMTERLNPIILIAICGVLGVIGI